MRPLTLLLVLVLLSLDHGRLAAAQAQAVHLDLKTEWLSQLEVLAAQIDRYKTISRFVSEDRAYHKQAMILASDKTPVDIVLRRTAALIADLEARDVDLSAAKQRLAELQAQAASAPAARIEEEQDLPKKSQYTPVTVSNADALMPLFSQACQLQREVSLKNPLLDFNDIVFVERNPVDYGHMCDEWYGRVSEPGGSLYILRDAFGDQPELVDLLADAVVSGGTMDGQKLVAGAFVTPEVDYDADTIYFAYSGNTVPFSSIDRKQYKQYDEYFHSPETAFHIFAIDADGSNLRMLTSGTWNDFYPAVLPNGRICFLSERRGGEGRCHPRPCPTYVMHTMLPDGSDITPISYHEINEWSPVVTNDGRIIYSRWDYVDRHLKAGQYPWIADPDGRNVEALYGQYEGTNGEVQADLRPVPDSSLFFGTMYGHHSASWGTLVVYDSDLIDDGTANTWKYLTPEVPHYKRPENRAAFATPYPLSEKYYLCAYSPDWDNVSLLGPHIPERTPHGVYLVDCFGNKTLLYRGQDAANMPHPLRPRQKPPILPHAMAEGLPAGVDEPPVAQNPDQATVAVMNVYDSKLPFPEDRTVTALRIVQVLPKSTPGNGRPGIQPDDVHIHAYSDQERFPLEIK